MSSNAASIRVLIVLFMAYLSICFPLSQEKSIGGDIPIGEPLEVLPIYPIQVASLNLYRLLYSAGIPTKLPGIPF